jgi:hypothetical protein
VAHLKMYCSTSFEFQCDFQGHAGDILVARFSPDGSAVLSGSGDHTLRWAGTTSLPTVVFLTRISPLAMIFVSCQNVPADCDFPSWHTTADCDIFNYSFLLRWHLLLNSFLLY